MYFFAQVDGVVCRSEGFLLQRMKSISSRQIAFAIAGAGILLLCTGPHCGAGEERIDGRLKTVALGEKLAADRLGGKPEVEKPQEELSAKRLQRTKTTTRRRTDREADQDLSDHRMKRRRVVSSQL